MFRRHLTCLLGGTLIVLIAPPAADACTCAGPGPACQAAWQADAVFVAYVDDVEQLSTRRRVRLQIIEPLLGTPPGLTEVDTGLGGGDCGYDFVPGETYVIYARRTSAPGRYQTGICTRTRPLREAAEDLEYLRGPARIPSELGTIRGVAKRLDARTEGGAVISIPFPGADRRLWPPDRDRDRERWRL